MKKKLCVLMGLALALSVTACGGNSSSTETTEKSAETTTAAASDDKAVTLKVGGIQTTEDPSTQALYMLAEKAGELSGGSLTVEVYPASQLGNATAQIEAVSMGSQDMFVDAGWWEPS